MKISCYRGFKYIAVNRDKDTTFQKAVDSYYEYIYTLNSSYDIFENEEEIIAQAVLTHKLPNYNIVRNDLGSKDGCIDLIGVHKDSSQRIIGIEVTRTPIENYLVIKEGGEYTIPCSDGWEISVSGEPSRNVIAYKTKEEEIKAKNIEYTKENVKKIIALLNDMKRDEIRVDDFHVPINDRQKLEKFGIIRATKNTILKGKVKLTVFKSQGGSVDSLLPDILKIITTECNKSDNKAKFKTENFIEKHLFLVGKFYSRLAFLARTISENIQCIQNLSRKHFQNLFDDICKAIDVAWIIALDICPPGTLCIPLLLKLSFKSEEFIQVFEFEDFPLLEK